MTAVSTDLAARITALLEASAADRSALRERLDALAQAAHPHDLAAAAESFRNEPDVIAPLYERIVEAQPDNAHALVILANAWWLQGRGPQAVGDLAAKAIAADAANRGAWHLWALSEPDPRGRTHRWHQVTERFPQDQVALAALADNATAVAGAEHDYEMLDFAIASYERLLERSADATQRDAVSAALAALRNWRL